MKNSSDTYRDEEDSEISKNLDILENSEDNSVEAGDTGNSHVDSPVP